MTSVTAPEKFSKQDRIRHVLMECSRPEGALVQEVALKYDTGEQNRYNPVFNSLEKHGIIEKDGKRPTASGRRANIYFVSDAGYQVLDSDFIKAIYERDRDEMIAYLARLTSKKEAANV